MMGSSAIQKALKASLSEDIESRLRLCRKTVASAEKEEVKSTFRLCVELRHALSSIDDDAAVTPDQQRQSAELRLRVGKLDPRKAEEDPEDHDSASPEAPGRSRRFEEREWFKAELAKHLPLVPAPDGFDANFINIVEAIGRVSMRFGNLRPANDDPDILTTALGDRPLDENAVRQLWLGLANHFKRLGGSVEPGKQASDLLPSHAVWIQTAVCCHANRKNIGMPAPNCFNVAEELAFRS